MNRPGLLREAARHTPLPTVLTLFITATLWGCGAREPDRPQVTEVDSAGVRIVTSPDADGAYATARLDTTVALAVDGDTSREYYQVRGVLGLPDGGVVIADAGSRTLRFLDGTGSLLRVVGGEGTGPGEFRNLSGVHPVRGDSVAAADGRTRRVTVFDHLGNLGRTIPYMPASAAGDPGAVLCIRPYLQAVLETADQLQLGWSCLPEGSPEGFTAYEADLLLWSPASETTTVLTRVPVVEVYAFGAGGPEGMPADFPPFGKTTSVAVHGDRVYVSTGGAYQVSVFDRSGALRDILRLERAPQPIGPEHRERFAAEAAETGREMRTPFPAEFPAWAKLLVDDGGRLWAQRYAAAPGAPMEWDVLGPRGEALGHVTLPSGVTLYSVRGARAYAVLRDSLDVEHPVVFHLVTEDVP